jgi:hypothetical protein
MADNIQRSKGRGASYKFDRGGMPAEFGPYIGVVRNNVDPTRSGRLQVFIEQFAGDNPNDPSLWRTVSYVPPFYGVTPRNNSTTTAGTGNYKGNQQSYGMWFTPPDIGVSVICFFVAGDPNQGYYMGCVPDPGITHMIPAVGASAKFVTQGTEQQTLTTSANAKQLPVVEINSENAKIFENPRFFAEPKPVHSYQFSLFANQGLLGDYIRGPISSSSQRESPSAVFGMSTPGRAIYRGGLAEKDIKSKLAAGSIKLSDIKVEGRRGGHSFVMDDGDLQGRDNLVRIRTSKGHQITMSDEADCFYFVHANGSTWIELGSEGTVDVYSTNSVNVRSQGVINLHADKDININAGENLNIRAKNIQLESQETFKLSSIGDMTVYSKSKIGVLSDGTLTLQSETGGWKCSGELNLQAQPINLNSGSPDNVEAPKPIKEYKLDGTQFEGSKGWQVDPGAIETIVTRAPTHEPYPYHNKGVPVEINYSGSGAPAASPEVENALAGTENSPVTDAVDEADVLSTPIADVSVGSLDKGQVTGLLAQAKSATNQASNALSPTKGIGEFGFTADKLEVAGFLKPGTLQQIKKAAGAPTAADIALASKSGLTPDQVAINRTANQLLTNPGCWTGKGGVTGLSNLLNNPTLQNTTQQALMGTTLQGLKSLGVVTGTENPQQLAGIVQSATKFGVTAASSFVKGVAPPNVQTAITSTIKNAQYATNLVTTSLSGLFGGGDGGAPSATGTVNRTSVDASVKSILNDAKIPAPIFKPVDRA